MLAKELVVRNHYQFKQSFCYFRNSKYKVEVNSDVVSVRMPGMENVELKDPIQITFYNRHVGLSILFCFVF